jgi:dipeptidase E
VRLFLSSFRMSDRFDRLLQMAGPGARCAVISNAVDFIPPDARRAYAERIFDPIANFRDHGVEARDLDLREHFWDPAGLEAALADVQLVWAVGGNSFLLRRAMRQSGFDQVLRRRLAEDSLVYGGWSAGAVVAGSSLRGIELMDEPDLVMPGYDPDPVWEGLGLVDYVIVPHFGSDHPEAEAAARAAAHLAAQGVSHRTLRDGEAIIVDGDRVEAPA